LETLKLCLIHSCGGISVRRATCQEREETAATGGTHVRRDREWDWWFSAIGPRCRCLVLSQSLLSASHLARAPLHLFERVGVSANFWISRYVRPSPSPLRSPLLCAFFTESCLQVLGVSPPVYPQQSALWPFHAIVQAETLLGICQATRNLSGLYARRYVKASVFFSLNRSLFLPDSRFPGIFRKLICIDLCVQCMRNPL
jgi:hypothetical protein